MPRTTPSPHRPPPGRRLPLALLMALLLLAGVPATGWCQAPPPAAPPNSSAGPSAGPAASAVTAAAATGPDAASDGMMMHMLSESRDRMADFRGSLARRLRATPEIPDAIVATLSAQSPTGNPAFFLGVIGLTLVFLAAGHGMQHLLYERPVARRLLPRARETLRPGGSALAARFPVLVLRALLTAIGMVIAGLIGFGAAVATLESPTAMTEKTVILVGVAYFLTWAIALFWRLVLMPGTLDRDATIPPSAATRRLWRGLSVSSGFGVAAMTAGVWLEALGMPYNPHAVLVALFGLLTALAILGLLHANRRTVDRALLGSVAGPGPGPGSGPGSIPGAAASPLERLTQGLWFPAAAFYFAYAWGALANRLILRWPVELPLLLGAYAVVVAILTVYAGVDYAVERLFHRRKAAWHPPDVEAGAGAGAGEEPSAVPPRMAPLDSYEALARRVASILAVAAGVTVTLSVWNVPMMHREWGNRLLGVMTVCLIGYTLYHAVRIWIDRRISEEGPEPSTIPGDEGGGAGSASRLATLLPLVRNFILVSIVGAVLLSVLMDLGFNIAPLFAGAGVAGIAIGFGAQTLIRDIFSGAFFLIDDAFRKGEYIEIGAIRGTVERISVRSMQLRHHRGPLHTVPFGEIHQLTNYSRDWVIMKLPLRITYDADVEKLRRQIKLLGQALLDDPELGPKFLQPLKSQGVVQMEDSAMILRVKFMTRPGDQWEIRKRVYQELHALFRREGVRFAHREVTVRFADDQAPAAGREAAEAMATGAVLHAIGDKAERF